MLIVNILFVVKSVKTKWRNLRDTFRVILAKCKGAPSGSSGDLCVQPTWPYYQQMLFLKDHMQHRPSSGSLQKSTKVSISAARSHANSEVADMLDIEILDSSDFDIPFSSFGSQEDIESSTNEVFSPVPKKKNKKTHWTDQIVEIEQNKLEIFKERANAENEENDEDWHFFKSMMPHMKAIAPKEKLSCFIKIQQIIEQFAYPT